MPTPEAALHCQGLTSLLLLCWPGLLPVAQKLTLLGPGVSTAQECLSTAARTC